MFLMVSPRGSETLTAIMPEDGPTRKHLMQGRQAEMMLRLMTAWFQRAPLVAYQVGPGGDAVQYSAWATAPATASAGTMIRHLNSPMTTQRFCVKTCTFHIKEKGSRMSAKSAEMVQITFDRYSAPFTR